jgi:hypothetical protein
MHERPTSAKFHAGYRRFASSVLFNYICVTGFILQVKPARHLAAFQGKKQVI